MRGAKVTLQRRLPSTSRWSSISTTTSDRHGRVDFAVVAPGTARYRLVVGSRSGHWAGVVGAARTQHARAAVDVTSRPTEVAPNSSASVVAVARPSEAGIQFRLQRRSSDRSRWTTVATTTSQRGGLARFRYRPTSRESVLRVVRVATARADQGISRLWRLTVR